MRRIPRFARSIAARVTRPIRSRITSFVASCLGRALDERGLGREAGQESALLLDTLIREHYRLQEQVEALRMQVEDLRAGASSWR